jgi:hypothetical protein
MNGRGSVLDVVRRASGAHPADLSQQFRLLGVFIVEAVSGKSPVYPASEYKLVTVRKDLHHKLDRKN